MTDDGVSLLCKVVRAARGQQQPWATIKLSASDGDALIVLASRHHVLAETLDGLRSGAFQATADTVAQLQMLALEQAGAVLRQQGELTAIVQAFSAIPMIVLKGMPLSIALYGDAPRRGLGDIDLFVDPAGILGADALLTAEGFMRMMPVTLSPARVAHYLKWSKTFIYRAPRSGTLIELHHRLTHVSALLPVSFKEAWEKRRMISVGSTEVSVLGATEEALYLCVHGAHHRWERLRWLIDVADLMKDGETQQQTLALARQFGLTAVVLSTLALGHSHLGLPLDPGVTREISASRSARRLARGCRLASARMNDSLRGKIVRGGQSHLYQLSLKPGVAFKISAFAASLVAAADADALEVPDYLLWLSPLLRPIGLYRRQGSAGKQRHPH